MTKRCFIYFILLTAVLFWGACSQEPFSVIEDPVRYTGTWGVRWVLFDDVLNTVGGDILYYPEDAGKAINYLDNVRDGTSYSGETYFHFTWSGAPIFWPAQPPDNPTNRYEHSFAGYSMIHTSSPYFYDMVPGLDLSQSGYTKAVFYARGKMASGYLAKFEGPNGALLNAVALTTNWTRYEFDLADLNNVKDFFKVTMYYPLAESGAPPGTGGYIDLDLVSYEK